MENRVWLGTGDDDFNNLLASLLNGTPYDTLINMEQSVSQVQPHEVVVLSEVLPVSVLKNGQIFDEKEMILQCLEQLRLKEVRVVWIGGHEGSKFITALGRMGIYDIVSGHDTGKEVQISPEDVIDYIRNPRGYGDFMKRFGNQMRPAQVETPSAVAREEIAVTRAAEPQQQLTYVAPVEEQVEMERANTETQNPSSVISSAIRTVSNITTRVGPKTTNKNQNESIGDRKQRVRHRTLHHVIVVGGPSGCGSSFVAWNLAALLNAKLMEGRKTGTLAAWLQVKEANTRDLFLDGNDRIPPVTATHALSEDDIPYIADKSEHTIVIDVGDQINTTLWKSAGKRVFVVTPDPRYGEYTFPNDVIRILNRYPKMFPTEPNQIFNIHFDGVIDDLGREAFLSLYSGIPWIVRQDGDTQKTWKTWLKDKTEIEETEGNSEWTQQSQQNEELSW